MEAVDAGPFADFTRESSGSKLSFDTVVVELGQARFAGQAIGFELARLAIGPTGSDLVDGELPALGAFAKYGIIHVLITGVGDHLAMKS